MWAADPSTIELRSRQFTPPQGIDQGILDIHATGLRRVHIILQFFDTPTDAQRQALAAIGVALLDFIPERAYFASVPGDLSRSRPELQPVRWIGLPLRHRTAQDPAQPVDVVDPGVLQEGVGDWARNPDGRVRLKVSFFADVPDADARVVISRHGGTIDQDYTSLDTSIETAVFPEEILGLATEDVVRWVVDVAPDPTEFNDGSRDWTKTDPVHLLGARDEPRWSRWFRPVAPSICLQAIGIAAR